MNVRRNALLVAFALILTVPYFAQAQAPIGWRTDGSGVYPTAQPPLEWSTTKNVVWSTSMPGYGVSHPVLLGKFIYNGSEPGTLLCIDSADGKIVWERTCKYSEIEIAPDVRVKLDEELAAIAELNKKESAVRKEMNTLQSSLVKDKVEPKEINRQLTPFRTQIDEFINEKKTFTLAERYTQPGIHSTAGYSAPTPVTNGRDIFVAYGNGLVACYDLDGNRKWLKLIEHTDLSFGHSASPILVGDKLLIQFTNLVALDTKTGNEVWRLKCQSSWGTPLATRIGDTDVVVTPKGALVRVADGKLLAEKLGSCGANSPIMHNGIVYLIHGDSHAVRMPTAIEETWQPDIVWKARVKSSGYGFSSPVLHDGLLYAASDQGIFTVMEADTGKKVYEERLPLEPSIYPSISLAGQYLYVSSERGTTLVLQPGREYKILAENKLEPFRSSLVFENKRVYIRTEKRLYCIGE